MKQNGKKGLSLPMEIIIGVVVLVVIALAVIMFTSGSITKTGTQTSQTGNQTNSQIQCNTQAITYCNSDSTRTTCTGGSSGDCSSCTYDVDCATIRAS